MPQSTFPDAVWNGLTSDRPYKSVYRPPDQTDWEQLVVEIQAIQQYLIDNPPGSGGSFGTNSILLGLNPNPGS